MLNKYRCPPLLDMYLSRYGGMYMQSNHKCMLVVGVHSVTDFNRISVIMRELYRGSTGSQWELVKHSKYVIRSLSDGYKRAREF